MGSWALAKPKCLPAGLGMSLTVGLTGVFIIAVLRKDVSPYVPFISEAGATQPEGGIFSILLYVTATLGIFTCVLRYMIVEECNSQHSKCMSLVNKGTLVLGILSLFGMVLVAAYPISEDINMMPHTTGAFLLFIMSLLYGYGQTWVSYQMHPSWHNLCICRIRIAIIIAGSVCLAALIATGILANNAWSSAPHVHYKSLKTPDDQGFTFLVISAVAEWTLAFLFVLYYVTFIKEFAKVAVTINIRLLVNHFDQEIAITDERTALL